MRRCFQCVLLSLPSLCNVDLLNYKQHPLWNISKNTQTCLCLTHNEAKLCMYAARGDTKHYSKSIQPVGLCRGRWLTGGSSPPSLIKGSDEALSILTSQKLVSAFCASWINRGSQRLAAEQRAPKALRHSLTLGAVFYPLPLKSQGSIQCVKSS